MPPVPKSRSAALVITLLGLSLCLTSCTRLLTITVIEPTVANLQQQTDLDLVCEGAPAYLLMIDSMIASSPKDRSLLRTGAQSYSAYTAALAECGAEQKRIMVIADKARLYGTTLIDLLLADNASSRLDVLERELAGAARSDVPSLFWGSMAWLTWIQQQQGAPKAMADLLSVEKIMTRLLELDETYQAGSIHLFFAGLQATRPAMLGGDPEGSRRHFEQALAISRRQFLLVQTSYAELLARQTLDQELHDRLLKEVLDFPLASAPAFALGNQIAKRKAAHLLAEDFFGE